MKRVVFAAVTLLAGLAACGRQETAATEPAPATAVETGEVASATGTTAMSSATTVAKGTGVVTAVDRATGTITLDHGPMPEAGWPAMTMPFKAGPELARSVKAGDQVSFDVRLQDGGGEITAIEKQ